MPNIQPTKESISKALEVSFDEKTEFYSDFLKFIDEKAENFVIFLDGQWGSGKTFSMLQLFEMIEFSRKLKIGKIVENEYNKKVFESLTLYSSYLRNNHLAFYFNAWKYDDFSNPILCLIDSILGNANTLQKLNLNDLKSLIAETLDLVVGVFGIELTEYIENLKELNFTEFETRSKEVGKLNQLLSQLLEKSKSQRILLIIDELDRCKPNFAIELIESIKHLFSNSNLTVVYSTNFIQLEESIRHVYGRDIDSTAYLSKFYDYKLVFENPEKEYLLRKVTKESTMYYHRMTYNYILKTGNLSIREANIFSDKLRYYHKYYDSSSRTLPGFEDMVGKFFAGIIFVPFISYIDLKSTQRRENFLNGLSEVDFTAFLNENPVYQIIMRNLTKTPDLDVKSIQENYLKMYRAVFSLKNQSDEEIVIGQGSFSSSTKVFINSILNRF